MKAYMRMKSPAIPRRALLPQSFNFWLTFKDRVLP